LAGLEHSIPERVDVIDALLTFATTSPGEERKHRVRAINALVTLGRIQDGYRYTVRRGKRRPLMPVKQNLPKPLPLECEDNIDVRHHDQIKQMVRPITSPESARSISSPFIIGENLTGSPESITKAVVMRT
jgi:hypothetical protein